jgi:hypothetical protein
MPDNDIDPSYARNVAEFALCMRQVRAQAGHPSLRELELRARRSGRRLPRSSVSDALAGRWLPRKELVLDLLQACGIDPAAHTRWVTAWTRLADQTSADAPAKPADKIGLAEVDALVQVEHILADAVQARRTADLEIAELKASAQRQAERHLAVAADTLQRARLSAELARDVAKTGLRRVGATFLPDLDWAALFAEATELDIFMAYGQTWRNLHAPELTRLARRSGSRIRIFLTDPVDQLTVSTLAHRFGITAAELRDRIQATRHDYLSLQVAGGADIQLSYWTGDRLFSLFRLDQIAVIGMYSHSRGRASAVPAIVCQAPGELFQFVLDELSSIEQQSRPC